MKPMKSFLLRMPEAMSDALDQIAEELYCTKSAFLRQSLSRNLDICRNVEGPAIRAFYRKRIPNPDLP